MATSKRSHDGWCFPLLALEKDPPSVERFGQLVSLSLTSRSPLEECEWDTRYGDPIQTNQISIMFRSESERIHLGDLLHSAISRVRAELTI